MPEEKFDDLIGVKCHKSMRAALKRIAATRGLEDTHLLRAAGMAIVDFAGHYGDPAAVELAITLGQNFARPRADLQMVAEEPAPYAPHSPALAAAQEAKKAFQSPPLPAPPNPPGSPPSAAAKHGRKSPRKSGPK